MELVKICCIDTIRNNTYRMSDFQSYELEDSKMIYINADNIISLSEITYKTVNHKRYYGYRITMVDGRDYWVKCNTNSYEYLSKYIEKENTDNKNIKKHLNKKK